MKKLLLTGASAMAALMLLAPAASAAVEFGDACVGNEYALPEGPGGPGYTFMTLSVPSGGLSLTAPSSGVITKVKMNVGDILPFAVPTAVKVLRPIGGSSYTAVGQTMVNAWGNASAEARMPVLAGDHLGLHGQPTTFEGSPVPSVSIYCREPEDGSVMGATIGDVTVGSTGSFAPVEEGRVPVAAVIEPDADKDGFGDETQDLCPLSAAVQTACPVITLSASKVVKRGFVTMLVTGSAQAPVTVAGTVSLGKGKKANLKGGTQIVAAGVLARFVVPFPKSVKSKLKKLTPKQKLSLKLTATATNVAGQPTVATVKAKLKGQAKPERKPKRQSQD